MSEEFDRETGELLPLDEYRQPLYPPIYRRSAEVGELFAALAKAQGEIEAAERAGKNPHFNAKYSTLDAVIEASRKPLADNGLAIMQIPTNSDGENISVTTLLSHASGQWFESTLAVKPARWDAQGMGSAITYLRRYTRMSIIGIAPEDDDGEAAVGRPTVPGADGGAVNRANPAVRKDTPARAKARAAYKTVQTAIDKATTVESLEEIYSHKRGSWGKLYATEIEEVRESSVNALGQLFDRAKTRRQTLESAPQLDAFGLAPLPDQPLSDRHSLPGDDPGPSSEVDQQQFPPVADAGLSGPVPPAEGATPPAQRKTPRKETAE